MNELGESKSTVELQQKFDEKRASVTKTVSDIRTTVTKEVEQRKEAIAGAKESVKEALDFKKQFQKHPLEVTAGVIVISAVVGSKLFARNLGTMEYEFYREQVRQARRRPVYRLPVDDSFDDESTDQESFARRQRARMARKSPFAALLALAVTQTAKVAGRMLVPAVMAAVTGKVAADAVDDDNPRREKKIVVVPPGAETDEESLSNIGSQKKTVITDIGGHEL